MKHALNLIFTSILFCFSISLQGQDVSALPNDPRVKTGTLANGLTYYIVKNEAVKGHADFAIAQKAGTSLETPSQKGMCKMLELLATRGTRNFTDSTIVRYLNSIGVDNRSIVFDTADDEIVYSIRNVPVDEQNTMDSTLLILYNWLGSINIDEDVIASATPMLKNCVIEKWDAQKRIEDRIVKQLFPDSPYAKSITLDQIKRMKRYSTKDLRNFYYGWFRPDLQAVFVVGDVDPATIETKVQSVFSTIPKPLKSQEREYYQPEIFPGTKVIIAKDPEYNKTKVSIDFLKRPLDARYKLTTVPYIERYFDSAIKTLLMNRIQSGIVSQNLPMSNLQIEQGKFMDMTNLEKFSISFETLPGAVYSAISFLSGEINRMARYGFNGQEFANSREMYFRELENIYDHRKSQPNSLFMKRAMRNYLGGYSLASIEMHFEVMKQILYNIKSDELNQYAAALLGQKEGVLISCCMPDVDGIEDLSGVRIQNSFINSLANPSASTSRNTYVKWPKFMPGDRTASVAQETLDASTGENILVLSNGIAVMFKQTTGSVDTVSFRAVSKGGLSVMKRKFGNGISNYISDIANLGGVGDLSRSSWEKLFGYNNLMVNARIDANTEELYGYAGRESLEKLFHLIQLNFTQRRNDQNSFDIYQRAKSYEAIYRTLSPKNVFRDSVEYYNRANKRLIPDKSRDYVNSLDYGRIFEAVNDRFANPADFVFVFAGNVDYHKIREYAVKYLGSLRTSIDREGWFVTPDYSAKGRVDRRFLYQMVIPQSYVDVTLSCGMDYTVENVIMGSMLRNLLERMCSNGVVKEFSPRSVVSADLEYYPEKLLVCNARFETDSAGITVVLDELEAKLSEVSRHGVSQPEFDELMRIVARKYAEASRKNDYWLEILVDKTLLERDLHTGFQTILQGITPQKFKDFVHGVYTRGNRITVVMEGTAEDVQTQNLFRENEFIKEFFDL